jgi:hypothetical protein
MGGCGARPWRPFTVGLAALSRPVADAEDHELGRPHRGRSDRADQAPLVEVVLGHRGAVTLRKWALSGLSPSSTPFSHSFRRKVLRPEGDRDPGDTVATREDGNPPARRCRAETVIENHDWLSASSGGLAKDDGVVVCNVGGCNTARDALPGDNVSAGRKRGRSPPEGAAP